jgi:hypothetical protein
MYTPITVRGSGVYQRHFLCVGGELSGFKDFILPQTDSSANIFCFLASKSGPHEKKTNLKNRVNKSRTTVPLSDTSDCIGYGIAHIPIRILSLRLYRQISTDTSDCIG